MPDWLLLLRSKAWAEPRGPTEGSIGGNLMDEHVGNETAVANQAIRQMGVEVPLNGESHEAAIGSDVRD